jgi:hypothetical protein
MITSNPIWLGSGVAHSPGPWRIFIRAPLLDFVQPADPRQGGVAAEEDRVLAAEAEVLAGLGDFA